MDPLHDNQIPEPVGWPDNENAPSVIRRIVETATVSRPAAISGEWDCQMVLFPWLEAMAFTKCIQTGNKLTYPSVAAMGDPVYTRVLNTLQCFCADANTPISIPDADPFMGIDIGSMIEKQGRHRLVGIGFEVVNTTPQLYRGGSVTSWRQAGTEFLGEQAYNVVQDGTPAVKVTPGDYNLRRFPPLSSRQAALTPNSVTWGAEEGVYIVGSFNDELNPATLPEFRGTVLRDNNSADGTWSYLDSESLGNLPVWSNVPTGDVWATKPFLDDDNATIVCMPSAIYSPLNISGCYFTGLSAQTTLTITLSAYVETFPNFSSNLLTLARPSLAENELVMREISRALMRLPVAVKASENNAGEWFARVIEALTPVVEAGLVAGGYGAAVPLLEAGSRKASTYARERGKAKQPARKPQQPKPKPKPANNNVKIVVEAQKPPALPARGGGFSRRA